MKRFDDYIHKFGLGDTVVVAKETKGKLTFLRFDTILSINDTYIRLSNGSDFKKSTLRSNHSLGSEYLFKNVKDLNAEIQRRKHLKIE